MNIFISTTFTFFICFSVFSQKEPKVKEIDYHFEFNSKDFIGEYYGEVLRVEIDGKKRKTPVGYGIYKGKYKGFENKDLWIVYNGNWHNGKLEGRGTFITLSTNKGIEPNWREIESIFTDSSLILPKSINEYYLGRFSNNIFNGDSSTIKTSDYEYYGGVVNWLPNGNGKKIKNDTLIISSIPMMIKEYEGVFTNGKFENGVIRLLGGDELMGDLKDGLFTGETEVTFFNKLPIALADTIFQAVSYFGKIKNNKFDNGQMSFESGDTLTGDWIDNLFTGKGKLNVGAKYWYEGDWEKGRIQGKGKKVIDDTLYIESVLIFVKEYEGQFSAGIFENGSIRIAGDGEFKGILKDGKFSGEGKMTFQKSLAISLAKNSYEAISYSGKIIDSKFDNGQMKLKSGETLTGVWTNKLFSGNGKLNIGEKYSYDGDWLEGDIHGKGKITKKNEWEYSGSFDKNQLVGSGELMYFIGNTYIGNFQGKLEEGQIDITLANNEKLKISHLDFELNGEIIDNKLIGFGELVYENKASYKGSFAMPFDAERIDEKLYSDILWFTMITSGEGRLTYLNGDTLHVRIDKDGHIGKGRLNFGITENGDSLYEEGTFRNGLLEGTGKKCFMYKLYEDQEQELYVTYIGSFQGGAMNGLGVLDGLTDLGDFSLDGTWVNNAFTKGTMVETIYQSIGNRIVNTYLGDFYNNQLYGKGVLKSDEGTYTGNFIDGVPHGNGKYVYTDGGIYEGEMKDGAPHGNGKYIYTDGRIYEGEMKDGVPNGVGKMTLKNKQVLNGKFENGEYQKPKIYKQAKIGNQVWMTENLSVTQFRNGDLIPEAHSIQEWKNAGDYGKPAWCYVEGDESMSGKFGLLYNWYAVNDPRGLAPEGWHIPSDYEWNEIAEYLGGEEIAGEKMKSKEGWERGFNGSNSCGFNGLPGGDLHHGNGNDYFFTRTGPEGNWWSSTEYDNKNAIYRRLWWGNVNTYAGKTYPDDELYRFNSSKNFGFSVRCIRD